VSEPALTGYGLDPETSRLEHFEVTHLGERILVVRTVRGWQAGIWDSIEEIAARHAEGGKK
jgi:hypothetical protein